MSAALPMAIDARHLTYRYGQFTAVDDVTLQVRPGETMGLLGPNGAGKTTMVRMLTTLAPVQQGELHIFGMDARRQTTDIRSNIGYVPQQLSIEPALTGRQNVEWFARLYGVPRAERSDRVDQALVAMDLLGVADRMASAYSGGMVRRPRWRRRWSIVRRCWCWTSRPWGWIPSRATACGRRCERCRRSSA